MQRVLSKAFRDLFSMTTLGFIVKTTLISLLITGAILWMVWGYLKTLIVTYLQWIPWEWLQSTGANIALVATAYTLFIVVLSVVTSLMIEPLLKTLAKRRYPNVKVVGAPSITRSLILSVQTASLFFILFLIGLPLMFVPFVGAFWLLWLWSIPLYKPSLYDVRALFSEKIDPLRIENGTLYAMVAAAFNYIPFLNVFAPVFAETIFLHAVLSRKERNNF